MTVNGVGGRLELYPYDAGYGDCLRIRFCGESGTYRNILVDSGTRRFGPSYKAILQEVQSTGECVDILLITHTDEDHLGGLLYMVNHGIPIHASIVLINRPQNLPAANGGNTPLSVPQANRIIRRLITQKIDLRNGIKRNRIDLDGARLQILSPTQEQVEAAFSAAGQNTPLGIMDDRGVSLEQLMEQPLSYKDTSSSNRASIIFVLEYAGKKLLFAGDAWSDDLLDSVRDYAGRRHEKLPVCFDAVKLPHHGSAGNISEAWPNVIRGERYILCADGRRHPSKQTIAKLLSWYGDAEIVSPRDWWSSGYFTDAEVERFIRSKHLRLAQKQGGPLLW